MGARLEAVKEQTKNAALLANNCRLVQSSESSHEKSYASSCSPEPTQELSLPAEVGGSSVLLGSGDDSMGNLLDDLRRHSQDALAEAASKGYSSQVEQHRSMSNSELISVRLSELAEFRAQTQTFITEQKKPFRREPSEAFLKG